MIAEITGMILEDNTSNNPIWSHFTNKACRKKNANSYWVWVEHVEHGANSSISTMIFLLGIVENAACHVIYAFGCSFPAMWSW